MRPAKQLNVARKHFRFSSYLLNSVKLQLFQKMNFIKLISFLTFHFKRYVTNSVSYVARETHDLAQGWAKHGMRAKSGSTRPFFRPAA
jgi:hypothetical protein